MKPKFELDGDDDACCSARLVDPDAFDASEQQFAASLEPSAAATRANFILDQEQEIDRAGASSPPFAISESALEPDQSPGQNPSRLSAEDQVAGLSGDEDSIGNPAPSGGNLSPDLASWRNEVAARVNKYRARRRPREPRYPSLQLKFEPYESLPHGRAPAAESAASPHPGRQAISLDSAAPAAQAQPEPLGYIARSAAPQEISARILEFPRLSTIMPPRPLEELAEPVFDRPRILEVPDIVPPPPALGGILIEAVEPPAIERRPGFEVPLRSAPMSRRLAAAAIDALIVLSAFGVFCSIFFRITATIPDLERAAGAMGTLLGMFWVGYQYLLLVYAATTPGLKLAKLRLDRFDGRAVPRKVRRWRVLASVLSGLSLGLGYAWCFLDEDQLCWHDRITRTYMAPIK
jgi:uncharacterized RDD family membrane protein YckC